MRTATAWIAGGMYDGRLLSSLWEEKPELLEIIREVSFLFS